VILSHAPVRIKSQPVHFTVPTAPGAASPLGGRGPRRSRCTQLVGPTHHQRMAQHLHEFSRGWPRPGGDLPAKSPGRSGPQHHLTGPPRISPPRRPFSCPSSCRLVGARTRPSKNLPLERVAHTRTSLLGRQNGAQLAAAWRPVGPNPSTDRPCPMTAAFCRSRLRPTCITPLVSAERAGLSHLLPTAGPAHVLLIRRTHCLVFAGLGHGPASRHAASGRCPTS
jgi:hypothetical protein